MNQSPKRRSSFFKRNAFWIQFIAFAVIGIYTKKDTYLFLSESPYPLGKYFIWALFFAFLGYTIYCSRKENFIKSVKRINKNYWGRQISLDLYLGLLLPLTIVYIHAGPSIFLLWLIPILINANLFTLLYFGMNYDSIIQQFVS